MTFLWLIFWLLQHSPEVHLWNAWAVALAVCVVIDVLDAMIGKSYKREG